MRTADTAGIQCHINDTRHAVAEPCATPTPARDFKTGRGCAQKIYLYIQQRADYRRLIRGWRRIGGGEGNEGSNAGVGCGILLNDAERARPADMGNGEAKVIGKEMVIGLGKYGRADASKILLAGLALSILKVERADTSDGGEAVNAVGAYRYELNLLCSALSMGKGSGQSAAGKGCLDGLIGNEIEGAGKGVYPSLLGCSTGCRGDMLNDERRSLTGGQAICVQHAVHKAAIGCGNVADNIKEQILGGHLRGIEARDGARSCGQQFGRYGSAQAVHVEFGEERVGWGGLAHRDIGNLKVANKRYRLLGGGVGILMDNGVA